MPRIAEWAISLVGGGIIALLLARVVALLLAARPDNAFIVGLYTLSEPLRLPLAALDRGLPQFGARFELSALAMAGLVLLCWVGVQFVTKGGFRKGGA